MIGQQKNINRLKKLISNNKVPQFILIEGSFMYGKKYFINYILELLDIPFQVCSGSLDDLFNLIQEFYTNRYRRALVLYDFEDYNFRSKESILKFCEEPVENQYIIISCNNINRLKDTIRNRAFIIRMYPYKIKDLQNYKYINNLDYNIFNTPSKILHFEKYQNDYMYIINNLFNNVNKPLIAILTLVDYIKHINYEIYFSILYQLILSKLLILHKEQRITNNVLSILNNFYLQTLEQSKYISKEYLYTNFFIYFYEAINNYGIK